MNPRTVALSLPLLFSGGCGDTHADHADDTGGHAHAAVHEGGVIVELGDHFAQLEVLVDGDEGTLSFWFWDHGDSIRLTHKTLEVEVTVGGETFELSCTAQASELTGETVGDSSEFSGTDERLEGAHHVTGTIAAANVKGTSFEGIEFDWSHEEHE